jgi:hypothetical protein
MREHSFFWPFKATHHEEQLSSAPASYHCRRNSFGDGSAPCIDKEGDDGLFKRFGGL